MPIEIPTICWYTMPSNCTYIFSMRKVKASHNSVQVQHVYESYFLLEKNPALSDAQRFFFYSLLKAKEKYRGVFKIQKSGDKTSSGEIGLDIRTHASPKVGQDQVSGGVSVLCWHAAPVAYVLWKPCTTR